MFYRQVKELLESIIIMCICQSKVGEREGETIYFSSNSDRQAAKNLEYLIHIEMCALPKALEMQKTPHKPLHLSCLEHRVSKFWRRVPYVLEGRSLQCLGRRRLLKLTVSQSLWKSEISSKQPTQENKHINKVRSPACIRKMTTFRTLLNINPSSLIISIFSEIDHVEASINGRNCVRYKLTGNCFCF